MQVALESSRLEPSQAPETSESRTDEKVLDTGSGIDSRIDSPTYLPPEQDPEFDLRNGLGDGSAFGVSPEAQKLREMVEELNTLPSTQRLEAIVELMNQSGRFANIGRTMTRFEASQQNAELEQLEGDILEGGVSLEEVGLLEEAQRLRSEAANATVQNPDEEFEAQTALDALPDTQTDLSLLGTEVFPQSNMQLADAVIPGLKLVGRYFAPEGTELLEGDIPAPGETLNFAGEGVLEDGTSFGFRGIPVKAAPTTLAEESTSSVERSVAGAVGAWNDVALYAETDPVRISEAREKIDTAIGQLKKLASAA